MNQKEFDKFAEEYTATLASNIRTSGETPEFFAEYKVQDVAQVASERRIAPNRLMDFGAGVGLSVPWFQKHLPNAKVTCVDVSRRSLDLGRGRFGQDVQFVEFDGRNLPFEDEHFDVAYAACVFHHIDAELHVQLLKEIHRVLRKGGMLAVFEHNPINPLTVRAVNTCPFDENAVLIGARTLVARLQSAGFASVERRYRVFFPRALSFCRPAERWLRWCPLGAQYSLFGIAK